MTIAKQHDVTCTCGAKMILRETSKYKWNNGQNRLFYGCSMFPKCKGTHGAHPNGEPLGTPADTKTKAARMVAHASFDLLWKPMKAPLTRDEAYLWMQSKLGMTSDQAHIGKFTVEQCESLCKAVAAYLGEPK